MDLALLALRLVAGGLLAAHGAQKLWGAFGGPGPEGTARLMESVGLRPGRPNALAAGWAELAGGGLLALGLLSPLAALLVVAVMTTAILGVHRKNGPWATQSGYEYNVVLMAVAFVVAADPGGWSLDAALGLGELHGSTWAITALALGLVGGFLAYVTGRAGTQAAAGSSGERFGRVGTQDRVER